MLAVKIALGQINPTIGDFDGNRRLVLEATARGGGARRPSWPSSPSWRCAAIRRRICSSAAAFLDAAAASLQALAPALAGSPDRGPGRVPGAAAAGPVRTGGRQQRRADRGRPGRARRAQVAAADLRRLRRVALLRAGDRGRADAVSRAHGSASRSARTSGTTPTSGRTGSTAPIRSRRWWPPAPRSSSTSRPRRTRSRSATCARACSRPRRAAGGGRCCSSTRWAARTIWSSTARAWRSTPPAR